MKKQTKTIKELMIAEFQIAQAAMDLRSQISAMPFSREIKRIINDNTLGLERDADLLVAALNDRDSPLSAAEIKAIFVSSGFEFTESDISACNPDSAFTIAKYTSELNWAMDR